MKGRIKGGLKVEFDCDERKMCFCIVRQRKGAFIFTHLKDSFPFIEMK